MYVSFSVHNYHMTKSIPGRLCLCLAGYLSWLEFKCYVGWQYIRCLLCGGLWGGGLRWMRNDGALPPGEIGDHNPRPAESFSPLLHSKASLFSSPEPLKYFIPPLWLWQCVTAGVRNAFSLSDDKYHKIAYLWNACKRQSWQSDQKVELISEFTSILDS